MQTPTSPAKRTSTVVIDATLHGLLNLIRSRDTENVKKMKEIVEEPLWAVVADHREWLEQMTGKPVSIPQPAQLELAAK